MIAETNTLLIAPVEAVDGPIFSAYKDIGFGGTESYSRLLPGRAKLAASRSWSLQQEVNKGTDGNSGPYRRYKLYAEGNAACWSLAALHPERIPHGDLGKYDITNPRHTHFLEQKGVIPPLSPYNEGVHDAR